MSQGSNPVPRQQTLRVEFDPSRPKLTVSPTRFEARPGDTVIWQFFGLGRQWYPWIRFSRGSLGETGTGPLEQIFQSSDAIWGIVGESHGARAWEYRASARVLEGLDEERCGATVSSSAAMFETHDGTAGETSRDLSLIEIEVEAVGKKLVVPASQKDLRIHGGQSIQWNFPPDVFADDSDDPLLPRVQFLEYDSGSETPGPLDLRLGPFTTMAFGERSVTATGYAQNNPGRYHYRLVVARESDGEIVWASSPDPLVDDLGEPPPRL